MLMESHGWGQVLHSNILFPTEVERAKPQRAHTRWRAGTRCPDRFIRGHAWTGSYDEKSPAGRREESSAGWLPRPDRKKGRCVHSRRSAG